MANVTLRSVRKTYAGGFEAIKGIDFDVGDGQFCVLVGPSGCGKSTLLRMVAGLIRPSNGAIFVRGAKVERPLRDVGMVFQAPVLLPWRTTLGNILFVA